MILIQEACPHVSLRQVTRAVNDNYNSGLHSCKPRLIVSFAVKTGSLCEPTKHWQIDSRQCERFSYAVLGWPNCWPRMGGL